MEVIKEGSERKPLNNLNQLSKGVITAIIGFIVFVICYLFAIGRLWTYIPFLSFGWVEAVLMIPMLVVSLIGLIVMFFGPIYFWIVEPTLKKRGREVKHVNTQIQFLKGVGVAIIGYVFSAIFYFLAISRTGATQDPAVIWQREPLLFSLSYIGLFMMFIGPIYFWVIEPIWKTRKEAMKQREILPQA